MMISEFYIRYPNLPSKTRTFERMAKIMKTQKHKYAELGAFTLSSDTLRITDPTYDKSVWCSGAVGPCFRGNWDAAIVHHDDGMMGKRVAMLCVKAQDAGLGFDVFDGIGVGGARFECKKPWKMCAFEVGVDSGTCGIFDDATYEPDVSLIRVANNILSHGVVSDSGYGDGGYRAFTLKDAQGKVCAVAVSFI